MSDKQKFKLPADVLSRLSRRSDSKGLIQLLAHLSALLLAGIGLQMSHGLFALPALLLYGLLLTCLFAPLHESIHFTAFNSRWLNNLVAAPIGFLLLIPFQYFRAFHYAHHRHTQDPQLDPELLDKKLLDKKSMTKARYWLQVSGLMFWSSNIKAIYQHAMGQVAEPYIDPVKHSAIIDEARYHVAGYAFALLCSVILASAALWWYWVLPALLTQPLLRLFLLAEHGGCDFSDNMLENSRTTYTSPIISFLCWNMCYHAEHHYLASIPFHALPALHAYTGQQVKYRGDGYYRVNREIEAQI